MLVIFFLLAAACNGPTPAPQAQPETAEPSPTSTREDTPTASAQPEAVQPCRYAFPIQPATVASYSHGHHDYPATDIFAPHGATVVSPTAGIVDFVSRTDRWDPNIDDPATRGGLAVAIVGDDGIRYYGSHLDAIHPDVEEGRRIGVGQPWGQVGDSGNARGIDPHLHFGISRPTSPEDWRTRRGEDDPYPYLNVWRDGQNLTPSVPGSEEPNCRPPRDAPLQ